MERAFAEYLKSKSGFERFMREWEKRYHSLGYFGGTIVLAGVSDDERKVIGELLGKDYDKVSKITVTSRGFMKALDMTKFSGVDMVKVLTCYFGYSLHTRKEDKEKQKKDKEQVIQGLKETYAGTYAEKWLMYIQQKEKSLLTRFIQLYPNNRKEMGFVLDAINAFPKYEKEVKSLAVFANQISKKPHFFDLGGLYSTYLLSAIAYFFNDGVTPKTQIEKRALMVMAGIVSDEVTNYITTYNIQAMQKDSTINKGLAWFARQGESLNLHVGNMGEWESLYGFDRVIVVENPSVFTILSQFLHDRKEQQIALICTNGELNVAAYTLFHFLKKKSVAIYYGGDFDPEGMLIAQKVYDFFEGKVEFLSYGEKAYNKAKSKNLLAVHRLEKLRHCTALELQEVRALLLDKKVAGYQESLIEEYEDFIMKLH